MDGAHLADEAGRLAAVSALAITDTGAEPQYEHITELARTVLDAPVAAVTIISADKQWFKSVQGLDICESRREDSFCTVTIRRPVPMIVEDALDHPDFHDNAFVIGEPFIRAYAGVPLALPDGHQVGALCVIDFKPRSFSDREIATLEKLARCVEKELALRLQANVDGLTGCLCRQTFFERVERAVKRVREGRTEASLALFDLDHFKRINDTRGHDAGDVVLRTAAAAVMREFSGIGEVGRIGGEEFAVLLPTLGADEALPLVERARERICRLAFPSVPDLAVTTSVGLTPIRMCDDDPVQPFRRADVALYGAKRRGRNRVEVSRHDADIATMPITGVADLVDAHLRDRRTRPGGRSRIGRH